jgi:hypothetical protein
MSSHELGLMHDVMMDDSLWLDSYQSTILQQDTRRSSNSTVEEKLTASRTYCCQPEDLEEECSTKLTRHMFFFTKPEYIDATMTAVDLLPAPEFVVGTESMVARQTNLLITRATFVMQGDSQSSKSPNKSQ